tara:strand:- start:114 stop:671 length:558 start_codon:yes stop_codon:yes gene_type:complete
MKAIEYLWIFASFTLTLPLCGQTFDADSKAEGIVVTHSEKLTGTIDVNKDLNQVLLTQGNSMRIISARDIKEVLIDGKLSYKGFELDDNFYLMEVIAFGHITIYFKEGIEKDTYTHKQYTGYFCEKNGKIREVESKKDFLSLFGNDEKWMSLRIKNQGFDLNKKQDIKEAFRYYNQSFEVTNPSP